MSISFSSASFTAKELVAVGFGLSDVTANPIKVAEKDCSKSFELFFKKLLSVVNGGFCH